MLERPIPLARQIVLAAGLAVAVVCVAFAFFFITAGDAFAVWVGIVSLAAILLIVGGIVVYFTRRAVVPIARVADATARVARGEQGVQVPEGGAGEVAILARSFNEMAATLDLRRAELESVLDATAEGLLMTDVHELVYESEFTVLDVGRTFFGHTAPVRDANGGLLGRIFTLREMTAERESERLKDEFVATVSHELRTPLTSIRGFVELLLAGEGGDLTRDQQRFLGIVERNAERLLRLVGDLLLIAQLDAGTMRLEWTDVDVVEIAAEAVEASRPSAEEAGLLLVLHADRGAPMLGDRARLAQLVDNLLSNAIKFTPRGGRVEVRAHARDGRVQLAVADTGSGISPEELPQLFTRFYRTRGAGEKHVPGTGLGLAISKAIAEAHGGAIEVESAVGAGTTFTVVLPGI